MARASKVTLAPTGLMRELGGDTIDAFQRSDPLLVVVNARLARCDTVFDISDAVGIAGDRDDDREFFFRNVEFEGAGVDLDDVSKR